MVVAETIAQAKDAAELVEIDYEALPAVARAREALRPGAPTLWDEAPGNLCIDIEVGDQASDRRRLRRRRSCRAARHLGAARHRRADGAAHRHRRITIPRPDNYTLYTGSGRGVAKLDADLAQVLGVQPDKVRVVCARHGRQFRHAQLLLSRICAARRGRRGGSAGRSNGPASAARPSSATIRAAISRSRPSWRSMRTGNFLAVRGSNLSNLGAHAASFVSLQKGLGLMSSVYRIPVGYFRGRARRDQHRPDHPLPQRRPAGGDLCDRAADRSGRRPAGLRPVALRRRNMIPPAAQPYANPLGAHLRQRRLRRRRWTRRWRSPIGMAFRAPRAERESTRQTARHRHRQLCRDHQRRAARAHRDHRAAGGPGRAGDGHDVVRARATRPASRSSSPNGWACRSTASTYVAHDTARVAAGGGSHSGRSMKLASDDHRQGDRRHHR